MAILRGLLFHWSAMKWFLGMDTRLQLGRERFEGVVSELRSLECSCCLTKPGTWFNSPTPTLFIAVLRESQDPISGSKIAEFRGRISCMLNIILASTLQSPKFAYVRATKFACGSERTQYASRAFRHRLERCIAIGGHQAFAVLTTSGASEN
jgi:hypothetical protein